MSKNVTGKNDTRDLTIGRGIVSVAILDTNGNRVSGYRDLGEASSISLNVASEELEHFSMRGGAGVKTLDKVVIIQQQVGISMSLQEYNDENLALAFSGEAVDYDNSVAIAGFALHEPVAPGYTFLGQTYELLDANGVRVYDIAAGTVTLATSDVDDVLETGPYVPIPLVEGTDFTVDAEAGLVYLLTDAPNVDPLAGISMLVAASVDAAPLLDEVRALSEDSCTMAYVAVKIMIYNAADCGTLTEINLHRVRLRSEGDIALLMDEYGEVPITGKAEENETLSPLSPTMTMRSFKRTA